METPDMLSMPRCGAKAAVIGFFLDSVAVAVEAPSRVPPARGSWNAMGFLGLVVALNLHHQAAALARRHFRRCGGAPP
jgi:hypothetical protein